MFLFRIIICFSLLLSTSAFAETVDSLDGIVKLRHRMEDQNDHWYSHPSIMGGLKSANRLGRVGQWGHVLKSREEVFLGLRAKSGWGIYGTVSDGVIVAAGTPSSSLRNMAAMRSRKKPIKAESDTDGTTVGGAGPGPGQPGGPPLGSPEMRGGLQDPGLAILHPLYESASLTISGQFKESFPVSSNSTLTNTWIQSYDSIWGLHLKNAYNLYNILSLRNFTRGQYIPPFFDVKFSVGLNTELTRRLTTWCKVGIGDRIQYDMHQDGPTGTAVELFTLADFNITPHITAGPRIHFPIASQGLVVSDIPTQPSIANIQAELYFQAAL